MEQAACDVAKASGIYGYGGSLDALESAFQDIGIQVRACLPSRRTLPPTTAAPTTRPATLSTLAIFTVTTAQQPRWQPPTTTTTQQPDVGFTWPDVSQMSNVFIKLPSLLLLSLSNSG